MENQTKTKLTSPEVRGKVEREGRAFGAGLCRRGHLARAKMWRLKNATDARRLP